MPSRTRAAAARRTRDSGAAAPGRAVRPLLGDLDQVADQVEELLPVRELVRPAPPASATARPSSAPRSPRRGIATTAPPRPGSRSSTASGRSPARMPVSVAPLRTRNGHGLEPRTDLFRGVEDRLNNVLIGPGAADRGQIGAEPWRLALVPAVVTGRALERRPEKTSAPAPGRPTHGPPSRLLRLRERTESRAPRRRLTVRGRR